MSECASFEPEAEKKVVDTLAQAPLAVFPASHGSLRKTRHVLLIRHGIVCRKDLLAHSRWVPFRIVQFRSNAKPRAHRHRATAAGGVPRSPCLYRLLIDPDATGCGAGATAWGRRRSAGASRAPAGRLAAAVSTAARSAHRNPRAIVSVCGRGARSHADCLSLRRGGSEQRGGGRSARAALCRARRPRRCPHCPGGPEWHAFADGRTLGSRGQVGAGGV
eukprot:ctg_165.g53